MLIIALSGRKQSGKTELSSICKSREYQILSFASSLKQLVCDLLNISLDKLNSDKEIKQDIIFNNTQLEYISNTIDINKTLIEKELKNKIFASIREILQFLGTEIIRKYNPDWHIHQLSIKLKPDSKYCIDDLRFKNEKEYLDKIGAHSFYILRPANFDISNHESEISLNWTNFQNIIINNRSLEDFRYRWDACINNIERPEFCKSDLIEKYGNKLKLKNLLQEKYFCYSIDEISKQLDWSVDKTTYYTCQLSVEALPTKYNYDLKSFLIPTKLHSYACGLLTSDGCIKTSPSKRNVCVSFSNTDKYLVEIVQKSFGTDRPITVKKLKPPNNDCYTIDCQSPLIYENLKYWNLKPRKSMREEIPDIIKNNLEMLKYWMIGLIDGDGSVNIGEKYTTLRLMILASKEICDFIDNICPIKSLKRQHKKTKLYELTFRNYAAIDFINWIGRDKIEKFGLKRKWSNIKIFEEYPRRQPRRVNNYK